MPKLLTDAELVQIAEALLNLKAMPTNTFAADQLTERLVADVPDLLETVSQMKMVLLTYAQPDNWEA